jgi:hypothetical protein
MTSIGNDKGGVMMISKSADRMRPVWAKAASS